MLPVKIREKLKLKAGTVFKIEIVGDKTELEQEVPKVQIVRNTKGLPVVMGWEGFDAVEAVQQMLEEQMDRLMPPKRE